MDEVALIQAARHGDLDAYNRLVLAYQDVVYHQAYRLISEPEAAEDAAQDAFIAAYRHLGDYRGGSFKAWMKMRRRSNRRAGWPTLASRRRNQPSEENLPKHCSTAWMICRMISALL